MIDWESYIQKLRDGVWERLDKHVRFAYLHYQIYGLPDYALRLRELKRYLNY